MGALCGTAQNDAVDPKTKPQPAEKKASTKQPTTVAPAAETKKEPSLANVSTTPVQDPGPRLNSPKHETQIAQQQRNPNMRPSEIVRSISGDPIIGKYLKAVPLLSKLTDDEREKLGGAVVIKTFRDKEMVFEQGQEGLGFYIIKEGTALLTRQTDDKKEWKELARLGARDYFGETALLTNAPRGGNVQAVGGPLVCFYLDKSRFTALFTEDRLNVQFAKRVAVSAEVQVKGAPRTDDIKRTGISGKDMSKEAQTFVRKAMEGIVLFQGLSEEMREQLLMALVRHEVKKGEVVVREGEPGNNMYIIESGHFDVYKLDKNTKQQTKIASKDAGGCFGELALMYNAPRAATVAATADSITWVMDRYTYRRITQEIGESRMQQRVEFLRAVDLLMPLLEYEREAIAEALEEETFAPNSQIFKQGEEGHVMFFIASGEVEIKKKEEGREAVISNLKTGDYFGERALLQNEPRAASAYCAGADPVHLLKLDRNAFKLLLGPLEDILKKKVASYEAKGPSDEPAYELKNDIKFEDLKVMAVLGKGSFGYVQLVKHKDTGVTYALKGVSKTQIVETRQQGHIMSEKRAMCAFNHPFIVKLHATYKSKDRLYFLLDPVMGGELFTVLRKNRLFPESTARFYAASVLLAFEHMHSRDYVYRDLKPENLLIDFDGYIKVTDFGFAKRVKNKTWTLCGTPEYLAPEIVSGKGHGKGVDWWTLGVLIFEMLASYTPFYHEDHMKMYQKIARGKVKYPPHFSQEARDLIQNLLEVQPTRRLGVIQGGAQHIKEHPWFSGFDWKALLEKRLQSPFKPKIKSQFDVSNFDDVGENGLEVPSYEDDGSNWDKEF